MKFLVFFICVPFTLFCQAPIKHAAVIVVGGGMSGLSCATACAKMGFATVVISAPEKNTIDVERKVSFWSGNELLSWEKTIAGLRAEFEKYGGAFQETMVTSIAKMRDTFCVTTENGSFSSVAVVIATGKTPLEFPLKIPAKKPVRIFQRLWDGVAFSPDETVLVVGNGELGLQAAIKASFTAKAVFFLMYPPEQLNRSALEQIAQKLPTISWLRADRLLSFQPKEQSISLTYSYNKSTFVQEATWIVLAEEWAYQTKPFTQYVQLDSRGSIVTQGSNGQTKTPGLFACGEVASPQDLLAIQAAASGISISWPIALYLLDHDTFPRSIVQKPDQVK